MTDEESTLVTESNAEPPVEVEVTLVGRVTYVVHASEDSGFRVFKLRPQEGPLETVVGVAPRLTVGDLVRVTGKRMQNERFGRQVKAENVVHVEDLTDEGVAQAIVQLGVYGVGPATARQVVAALGGGAAAVDRLPTLTTVTVVGERILDFLDDRVLTEIAQGWNARRAEQECDATLASLGLTPGLRARVYARYGASSVTVVREDPYRLCLEVTGVGFKTADEVATKLGVRRDDHRRVRAVAYYALQESADRDGHVYSHARLVSAFARSVGVPADEATTLAALRHLAEGVEPRQVVVGPSGGAALVHLYEAEADVALRVAAIMSCEAPLPPTRHGPAEVALSVEQLVAVDLVLRSRVSVLTGTPGTGKTTCTKALCECLDDQTIALCAPTGRAAARVTEATGRPASTIHRLLGYRYEGPTYGEHLRLPYDVVIVDEVSMVDSVLMAALLRALRDDVRLVLVGDPDQLPPVGPGAPLRDLLASGVVPVARLTEVHRQAAGSRIVQSANSVRVGGDLVVTPRGRDGDPPDLSGSLYFFPAADDAEAASIVVHGVSTVIPAKFGLQTRDVQVVAPTRKGACGVEALNRTLQAVLNPERPYEVFGATKRGDRTYRPGDRVMQTKNDVERDVVNGDLGYVVEAGKHGLHVRMESGVEVDYELEDLQHLDLAYATTVHKVQGSEFPAVVLVMMRSHYPLLTRTLLYTALTRAKQLCVVVGDEASVRRAARNVTANDRRTLLPSMLTKGQREA